MKTGENITLSQQSIPSDQTSLLGQEEEKLSNNFYQRLATWRVDDDGTNRTTYKVLCTVMLLPEFLALAFIYFIHGDKLLLVFFTLFTMLKFLTEIWGQETATWTCPNSPFLFLLVYIIGLPSVGYTYVICMSNPNIPDLLFFDTIPRDLLGAILFFGGTIYSWSYELLRFKWKKERQNKGMLHTMHHAKFHIHPNYFGDLFTYSGWALVLGTTCALSLPIAMLWMFLIFVCPNSDAYLAKRYRQDFAEYSQKTPTLIPFFPASKVANQCLALLAFMISLYYFPSCGRCS